MKKMTRLMILLSVVMAGGILYSCQKELILEDVETPALKKAKVPSFELTPMEQLGKEIFFDKISSPDNMSCAECHAPAVGFTGPIGGINKKGSVYRGAVPQRFGNRKPPSAAYATFSPIFHYDAGEKLFIGGNFWDGRATGEHFVGNDDADENLIMGFPAAEQALGPFLNPVEMNNPDKIAVLEQIADSKYADLWEKVWGGPVSWDLEDSEETEMNYDRIGLAIAAYEASDEVNQFSSKYDAYLAGDPVLTPLEIEGLNLFNGKAMCSACHPSEGEGALFTDFTFDNLGVPKNPNNPVYDTDPGFVDPGLGGFLETPDADYIITKWGLVKQTVVDDNMGKHKVPTLRNVGKANGNGFPKAYMHNGVFKSLKEVVQFYNTSIEGDWPPPEVPANVNTDELGNLGLTEEEEDAIVAFMMTLSDGWIK